MSFLTSIGMTLPVQSCLPWQPTPLVQNANTACNAQIITLETRNSLLPCIVMTNKLTQGTRDLFSPAYFKSRCFFHFKVVYVVFSLLFHFGSKVARCVVSVLGIVVFPTCGYKSKAIMASGASRNREKEQEEEHRG